MSAHRQPWERLPDCEYTAPGAATEALDCWADATVRHIAADGVAVGLFCDLHSDPGPNVVVETLEGI